MTNQDRARLRALVSGGVAAALGGALLVAGPVASAAAAAGVPSGVPLSPSGDITVTKDGTVIDAKHVKGAINVRADNVTIKRTKVSYSGYHSIRVFGGAEGTVLSQVTVECGSSKTNGVVFGNYTADEVALEGCRNGFLFSDGSPAVITESTVDGEPFTNGFAPMSGPEPEPAPSLSPLLSPSPSPSPPPDAAPAPEPGELSKSQVTNQAGPRQTPSSTISSSAAEDRIRDTGLLEDVKVNGMLDLSDVTRAYTIRDVVVDAKGGRYGIRTRVGSSEANRPPEGRQVIEHTEVYGASSAGLYVAHVTVRHADVWGNIDNVKSGDDVELYASWLHDQSWTDGAHADAIQIQWGQDQLIHWNVIDARYGSRGGPRAGQNSNAGIQMGSMNSNASAQVHNNWFNGGHYTVRIGTSDAPLIDFQYRHNKFGRDFTYGPVTGDRNDSTTYGGVRFDRSNVWADNGQSV